MYGRKILQETVDKTHPLNHPGCVVLRSSVAWHWAWEIEMLRLFPLLLRFGTCFNGREVTLDDRTAGRPLPER